MARLPKPKYEVIEKTLNKITKKPRTKATYRSYINLYFKLLDVKNPETYFTSKRDYTKDVWEVAEEIENMAPKTQSILFTVVKRFLSRNDIEIKQREWEDIASRNELKRSYAIIDDVIPTSNQLKHLLQFADPKIKTLVQFLSTTGCRINEALQLTWNNIDLNTRMVKISAEISKTSRKRYAFFTKETKEMLEIWQKERLRFIAHSMNKSIFVRNKLESDGYTIKKSGDKWKIYKDSKKIDKQDLIKLEQRVFPLSAQTATVSWNNLLERAGDPFNKKDSNKRLKHPRYRYHFHSLRKFWFHSFQNTDANKNHIDFIGGHQTLLDRTYTDFLSQPEKLKDTYDKFSSCLAIYESKPDLSGVQKQLEEKDKQIAEMERKIKNMENRRSEDVVHALLHNPDSRAELMKIIFDEVEKREKNKGA